MSLRVQDLIDNPALHTSLLAGAGGVDRTIHWAHSCDDTKPWEWLGQGELVMTRGLNVPADPEGQVRFVRSMHVAGLAGLALAKDMGAPPLTAEAADAADAIGFPILETDYEVPWVVIARAVAEATTRTAQLTRIMRVYDCYRLASQDMVPDSELLRRLGLEVEACLLVVDVPTGRPVLPTRIEVPVALVERIEKLATEPHLPGITRVPDGDRMHLLLPIAGHREVLVSTVTDASPDLVLLQHVTAIVSVLTERSRANLTARISAGMSLLSVLLEGRVDGEHAKERLGELGLLPGPWQVLALGPAALVEPVSALRCLGEEHPAVVVPGKSELTVLVRAGHCAAVVDAAVALVDGGRVGVSDVVRSITQLPDAMREARWALEATQVEGEQVAFYGIERPLFLPRTLSEARDAVARVLGVLLEYDEAHGTELVRSLRVYFASKRSWQAASRELVVHKQTLVYRMRRVEELTGRHLDDLDDITELHLALRSLDLLARV
jgi:purine catabolism regulator